jgi:LysM repeat protein
VRPPGDWRRYVAPAAFLLAVTIAVVLIHSGLRHGGSTEDTGTLTATRTQVSTATAGSSTTAGKRYWKVRAGDTFAVISAKTGVPVATIARLNPNVSSTSLFIGERIRYQ